MDLREQQLKYEEDTDAQAAIECLEALRASAHDGDVNMPRAKKFIARAYEAVKQSLDDAIAIKTRGVGGKFKGWLRKVPTDVAAVLALRECIAQVTGREVYKKPCTIQTLGLSVGKLYELEIRIRDAEEVNPMYMKKIHEQVQENSTTSKEHLRKLYHVAYERVMKGHYEEALTQSEILQLGKFGVQAVMDAGILVLTKTRGKSGHMYVYTLDPEVAAFLCDYSESDVQMVLNKSAGAMMCPPDPWTNLRDGGYLSVRRKSVQPLMSMVGVRKSERPRLRKEFTAEKMPVVFAAANYLQSIPFAVHAPTLSAIRKVWDAGGGVMGVPRRNQPVKPPCPFSPEWTKADATDAELVVFTEWKRSALAYYNSLKVWRTRVRELGGFIRVADACSGNIWFPMFFDKRGRWYYRGSPNPQGSDLAKSALHFGEKRALGQDGLYWLKVHIANCFGFDKVRFDQRAGWTDANWGSIKNALNDPENHKDVWGGDAPWCMFSAAYELNQALLSGNPAAYETGLIVHMDATCSGLQHFSAILRDPIGGGYVNLYDDSPELQGPKQDIYTRVASNALECIKQDSLDSDPEKAAVALWWLRAGIPRGMAKTPVMTYVYGATLRGTVDFVHTYITDEMGLKYPEDVRPYDYSVYAAKKLFQGIAATVPAAEAAMQWLKSIAKQQPNGQRMEWRSPTGFLVQHDYQDWDEVRVKLRSCGIVDVLIREYNEDTKPIAMAGAIAPNFVHALDAAHFTLTALKMQEQGMQVVGIHDSFGTHPSDVGRMHSVVRDAFVELYQSRNVLSEFLWEVNGIGEVPMRGTLDLKRVIDSEFFFC